MQTLELDAAMWQPLTTNFNRNYIYQENVMFYKNYIQVFSMFFF